MIGAMICGSEEDGWKEVTEADIKATAEVEAPVEADSGTPRQQPAHGKAILSPVLEDETAMIRRSGYVTHLESWNHVCAATSGIVLNTSKSKMQTIMWSPKPVA